MAGQSIAHFSISKTLTLPTKFFFAVIIAFSCRDAKMMGQIFLPLQTNHLQLQLHLMMISSSTNSFILGQLQNCHIKGEMVALFFVCTQLYKNDDGYDYYDYDDNYHYADNDYDYDNG